MGLFKKKKESVGLTEKEIDEVLNGFMEVFNKISGKHQEGLENFLWQQYGNMDINVYRNERIKELSRNTHFLYMDIIFEILSIEDEFIKCRKTGDKEINRMYYGSIMDTQALAYNKDKNGKITF